MSRQLLILFVLLLLSSCSENETVSYKCPDCNIILISIDTLRADHLGCYGYYRNTSPFIDSIAKQGIIFTKHISQAPYTSPSHMSMFTSLYPSQHLICQNTIPECNDMYGLSGEIVTSVSYTHLTLPTKA